MTKKAPNTTTKAKSTKKTATAPPTKAKQLGMGDGFDRKRIPELEDAAEDYRQARNTRQDASKVEKAKKTILMDLAKKLGIEVHVYEDEEGDEQEIKYSAETAEEVKVNKVKNAKAKDDE